MFQTPPNVQEKEKKKRGPKPNPESKLQQKKRKSQESENIKKKQKPNTTEFQLFDEKIQQELLQNPEKYKGVDLWNFYKTAVVDYCSKTKSGEDFQFSNFLTQKGSFCVY